ncbi:hypothetical protein [Streptomyces sp. Ag109_G2-15]|uniref:hypothetical protein n=1 Tax=Streptomyces sp. Ag109_G2-15 TaxID=1938850 RepID=UPI000BDDA4D9|nr:hypothetical protein [Streptomyces sp. Ag109_G2-15]SOD91574.1 hypothetical protein SAMN06272765_7229 [Streptomyces sp. Ag109_G2-15]
MPNDPSLLSRDPAKTLREITRDPDCGRAEYDSPRSAARLLRDLRELVEHLPQILLKTSVAVDRMTRDREDATAVARVIGEAATTATNLTDQLRRAHEAAQDVRRTLKPVQRLTRFPHLSKPDSVTRLSTGKPGRRSAPARGARLYWPCAEVRVSGSTYCRSRTRARFGALSERDTDWICRRLGELERLGPA